MRPDIETVDGLRLPKRLLELVDSGIWPRNHQETIRQNLHPLVSLERIRSFAPEEHALILDPPPFITLAEEIRHDPSGFWARFGALDKISCELTIVIADFGPSSDTVVALDYRAGRENPAVIRLLWRESSKRNTWVRCADSFDEFANMLGLEAPQPPA